MGKADGPQERVDPAPDARDGLAGAWDRRDVDALAAAIDPILRRVFVPELIRDDDREDVVGQTLLALSRKLASTGLETWSSPRALMRWLLETLRREALACLRRSGRRRKREVQDDEAMKRCASVEAVTDVLVDELLEEVMARLPPELRERLARLAAGEDPKDVFAGLSRRNRASLKRLLERRTREGLGLRGRGEAGPPGGPA